MDFVMHQGDSKRLRFSITDADNGGAALDISDTVVTWQASKGTAARFSTVPVLTKTMGGGVTVTDEMNGKVLVELEPADTQALAGTFYHELQLVDASGDVATAFVGEFQVKKALIS